MNPSLWLELQTWFGLRSARERGIVLITVSLLLFFGWDWFLQANLDAFAASETRRLQSLEQINVGLNDQLETLSAIAQENPNTLLRRTISRLNAQNDRLDLEIEAMSGTLVQPIQMANVLSQVMLQQGGVELLSIENRPPESLFFSSGELGDEPLVVFKHGLNLTLRGSYLDVLRYLSAIENLGVRFFWERVEYKSEAYPLGVIAIEVFTLSTQEQLLNV
ncbi:MAG: hypothetical protein ACPHAN_14085 [Pseudomonadales bacterium]